MSNLWVNIQSVIGAGAALAALVVIIIALLLFIPLGLGLFAALVIFYLIKDALTEDVTK
jgi:hypothetical protein